ncbi:MAG: tetratricopeptide repeat protein [Candidatus Binatia bacterium]
MARRRFRRKDLKRPDEFVNAGRAFIAWAQANVRLLSWIGAGVVLLVIAAAGFLSMRSARVRQSNDDLSHALARLRGGKYSQAAAELGDVAERWQSSAVGRLARLYAATADLKAHKPDAAAALLQRALHAGGWPSYLKQQALLGLGFALEEEGKFQAAGDRYAEAAAVRGPYRAVAVLGEARCRVQAGQEQVALKLYERFVREFPQAPEGDMVAAEVRLLQG